MKTCAHDYEERGPRFKAARETLEDGCEVPPSIEVFEHQLGVERQTTPGLSVEGMARRISERYHQTRFSSESDA